MQLWPEQQQSGTPSSKVSSTEVELLSITDVLLFHISWWPLCPGSAPSSLLVHSRPPFHLLWLPLSVLPKSSRLCVRTTSTKPYTSSPRDTARTTNQSVATSSLSLFPWPSLPLVSSAACSVRSFFLSLVVFTELHLIISLCRGSQRHCSHHLKLLSGVLCSHQFLLLPCILRQVSRWVCCQTFLSVYR